MTEPTKGKVMRCRKCAGATHVINSRLSGNTIYRRRECLSCGWRGSTYEQWSAREYYEKGEAMKPEDV